MDARLKSASLVIDGVSKPEEAKAVMNGFLQHIFPIERYYISQNRCEPDTATLYLTFERRSEI